MAEFQFQRPIAGLIISAIDQFESLYRLQELVSMALKELDDPSDAEAQNRAAMLLSCYQSRSADHLNQLEVDLNRLRERLDAIRSEFSPRL